MHRFRRYLHLGPHSRNAIAREIDAELAFHLEMRTAELIRLGAAPDDAARRARAEFGDIEFTRTYCRTMDERTSRRMRLADHLLDWRQDLKYGIRTLARSPGFAAVSMLTLALAIGANTAVFSVARAVLFAPLPFGDPARLERVYSSDAKDASARYPLSPADFLDFRAQQHSFTALEAMRASSATWVPEHGDPEILSPLLVTPGMFATLGVSARYGHTLAAGDDPDAAAHDAVLGFQFWQRAFGGDPSAIGRRMQLGGETFTIVGVMPPRFTLRGNEDLYMPLDLREAMADPVRSRKQHYLEVTGRLKAGVTEAAGRSDLVQIAARLSREYGDADADRTAALVPLHEALAGRMRAALLLLQAAALIVLLIACANLANLALSRAIVRRREMAVRAALGAPRARLMRQLLLESLALALVGGAAGVGLAFAGTHFLLALNPDALPPMFTVSIDVPVLMFSVAASIGAGVLFGILPAIGVARSDLNAALRESGRSSTGGRGSERLRRGLVVAQVALAVMLLIGSGLLLRSFAVLTHAPLGFASDHVLTADLRAAGPRYDSASAVNRFYDDVLREVSASPGVVAVGAASILPTQGNIGTSLRIEGQPIDEGHLPDLGYLAVRGDFFKALRIRLLAGRLFDATDRPDGPPVALLNAAAAKRYFPNGTAVGARVRIGPDPRSAVITILGVVEDVRDQGPGLPTRPTIIMAHAQQAWDRSLSIVIRTTGDPATATAALRRAVRQADPTLAVRHIETLDDVLGASLMPRRFSLAVVSAFAALALALAVTGIYGVLSYQVTSRTRELGVRLALGATTKSVLLLIVQQGISLSLVGLALGIAAAAIAGRLISGMLYGVSALDPWTYGPAAIGLFAIVVTACLVPAARAARVDPLTAMRDE